MIKEMQRILVIAGPQSAGKTTAIDFLKNKYGIEIEFYGEISQFDLFPQKGRLGGLVVDIENNERSQENFLAEVDREFRRMMEI